MVKGRAVLLLTGILVIALGVALTVIGAAIGRNSIYAATGIIALAIGGILLMLSAQREVTASTIILRWLVVVLVVVFAAMSLITVLLPR